MSILEFALLGTADAPPDTPLLTGTPADALIAQRVDDPLERKLLLAAGARAVLERAAPVPSEAPPAPAPCEPETRPVLPDAIATLLVSMMRGEHRDLLPSALARLGPTGYVLGPSAAAALLRRVQSTNHDAVRPLLGARARWLAGHNPSWAWVLDAPGVTADGPDVDAAKVTWEEGVFSARARALKTLREHAPEEANALLFAGWTSEPVKNRLRLLEVIGEALTPTDGPFLEHLVGSDRSQRVKDAARRLLVRTGSTAIAERMLERAAGALSLEAREPKKGGLVARVFGRKAKEQLPKTLSTTLPSELPEDWQADGIQNLEPPGKRWGRRAHWLVQVLSLVPPSALLARLGAELIDLVSALEDDDIAVLVGLSEGALLHGEAAICALLWDRWQRLPEAEIRKDQRAGDVQGRLLGGMDDAARSRRIVQLMESFESTTWWPPLAVVQTQWPEAVGRRWCELLQQHLVAVGAGGSEGTSWALTWRSSLTSAAARLPDSCLRKASDLYEPHFEKGPRWNRALPEFKSRISMRLRLEEALAALPSAKGTTP